jgi:hypothetical protein
LGKVEWFDDGAENSWRVIKAWRKEYYWLLFFHIIAMLLEHRDEQKCINIDIRFLKYRCVLGIGEKTSMFKSIED